MPQFDFLLSSEEVRVRPLSGDSPGLRRTRMELAKPGPLGRSFDNKCAHVSASTDGALRYRAPAR